MEDYNKMNAQVRLKELVETFDKKYLKQLFEEGEKMGLFGPHIRQNYRYEFEGYVYIISRHRVMPNIIRQKLVGS